VAIKTLQSESILNQNESSRNNVLKGFLEESSIMQRMRHPNIVLFMGICINPPMLIMELLPRGSVYDVIHDKDAVIHYSLAYKWAIETARGMTKLHSESIIHRDLKSKNLLVDQNWTVKVSDFGLSELKSSLIGESIAKLGTLPWTAPEIFKNEVMMYI
jgi:serine/threonine protein kinase